MLGIILGIFTIMLGIKGFTEKGLPWSRTKNIAGTPAKVIGAGCLMFGVGMVAEGFWESKWMFSSLLAPRPKPKPVSLGNPGALAVYWQRFYSDDRRFSAEFPGRANGVWLTPVMFQSEIGFNFNYETFYAIRSIDLTTLEFDPATPEKDPIPSFEELVEDMRRTFTETAYVNGQTASNVRIEEISSNDVPGRLIEFDVGPQLVHVHRLFLFEECLVDFFVETIKSKRDRPEIDRFFKSIEFHSTAGLPADAMSPLNVPAE